ncbi:hypothetical protein NHH03_27820 [Stieleria sp. TO1_6]|uniref:hypothetical protein n=1 Tax=Stieleria tagensis TaxID=2956795 RepID=UPI00209B9A43|nr:hypothetical protein [Stieleria tagensis]MCO8125579.1 hypothetical protein [Stieleria tagensis]
MSTYTTRSLYGDADGKPHGAPPYRIGFIRDETRAEVHEHACKRLDSFRPLDVYELATLIEYYILRWERSFGNYECRRSNDVKETEHCLASLVALEMRCNELDPDDLDRLRFGEKQAGGVVIYEGGEPSDEACGAGSEPEPEPPNAEFKIGYLSEGFDEMFPASSKTRSAAYVDLTNSELFALINLHILLAERFNGLVDYGWHDWMDEVAESYMSLVALEKEARRRVANRSADGKCQDQPLGFNELAQELATMRRKNREKFDAKNKLDICE